MVTGEHGRLKLLGFQCREGFLVHAVQKPNASQVQLKEDLLRGKRHRTHSNVDYSAGSIAPLGGLLALLLEV